MILNGAYEQIETESAPNGVINEYRFSLGEIDHADTLVFFINHHNAEVYFAGECVYSLAGSKDSFCTPGGFG